MNYMNENARCGAKHDFTPANSISVCFFLIFQSTLWVVIKRLEQIQSLESVALG